LSDAQANSKAVTNNQTPISAQF